MKILASVAFILALVVVGRPVSAGPTSGTPSATTRDGQRDFAFLFGTWRTHYMRLRHILSHNHDWFGCDGKSVVKPFWNGRGNLEDGDLRCPQQYIQGLTLRIYNAKSHQWSLYWANARLGLTMPPQVGHFDDHGVGNFYADDTYAGKPVTVRYRWMLRSGDHPRFEQAFSADHGKTWETNWTTDYTRISN